MPDSLIFRRATDQIADEVVGRCRTMKSAIKLCVEVSGLCIKEISHQMQCEEKWLSRVLADNPEDTRHFPPDRLYELMDICGNEVPLRWLALKRGYGLHKLRSQLEIENEELQRQVKEKDMRISTIMEIVKEIRGVA